MALKLAVSIPVRDIQYMLFQGVADMPSPIGTGHALKLAMHDMQLALKCLLLKHVMQSHKRWFIVFACF